jgi:hypothetical protein
MLMDLDFLVDGIIICSAALASSWQWRRRRRRKKRRRESESGRLWFPRRNRQLHG